MRFALLASLLQLVPSEVPQDKAEEEAVLAREKERIRSRAPLTDAEKSAYTSPLGPPLKPRDGYTLAVIPLEFSDRKLGATDLSKLFFSGVAGYYARASGGVRAQGPR